MSTGAHQLDVCAYCGLPVKPARKPAGDAARFCCFGCRFAAAVAHERAETGHLHWTMARLGLAAFFSMNVLTFTMVLWTHDIYDVDLARQPSMSALDELLRYACLLFSLPVLFLLGGPLVDNGLAALRQRTFTTDWLLLLGTGAAFGYSIVSVFRGHGHVYFEVGCVILVAVTLGRWLEATGKWKTAQAIESLEKLLPDSVRVVSPDGEASLPLREVRPGQHVRVLAGERIPLDGVLLRGQAAIDEQLWTGESVPVTKGRGDTVRGGTLNLDGDLLFEVTASHESGSVARLVAAVRDAALAKGRFQHLADRIAAWFTPLIAIVAAATFVGHGLRHDWGTGILTSLAVLLIACPCALGLATPMAVWSALGRGARQQVLFRTSDALAQLAGVKVLCFDKTGTLTTGRCEVDELLVEDSGIRTEVEQYAALLASGSTHVLSRAICEFSQCTGTALEISTLPGRGLRGREVVSNRDVYLGSVRLMREMGLQFTPKQENQLSLIQRRGAPLSCVGWDGWVRGVFVFCERLREEAPATLDALCAMGFETVILTGDYSARAEQLRKQLGVAVRANLLPEEKAAAVAKLRRQFGPVAMIGDGINDAPALAAADVGIALGCGADVSRDSASVCLLGNDLARIPWAIALARQAVRTIRWNLFWAFSYNVVGISLAATGLLNPILAAIAMTVSSVLVITNSLRLGWDVDTPRSVNTTGDISPAIDQPLGWHGQTCLPVVDATSHGQGDLAHATRQHTIMSRDSANFQPQ